jgi:hypothetical protein
VPGGASRKLLAPGQDQNSIHADWTSISEVKKIVYRMTEILFATEIAFRRPDGCMPQRELNLLKLATAAVAQLRTGSPQVVRCNRLQRRSTLPPFCEEHGNCCLYAHS